MTGEVVIKSQMGKLQRQENKTADLLVQWQAEHSGICTSELPVQSQVEYREISANDIL